MNYRTTTVLARTDLGQSGTKVIDIHLRDVISAFTFKIEATVVNTTWLAHLLDCVSKIELVDGSDVLESLSAFQMNGLHFFETGKLANHHVLAFYSTTVANYTAMLFGRWMHDPELAFDPTKFTNPQLRITYDATAVMALATKVYLTVLAECFDEKVISPVGFLRNTEHYRYSPTEDAYKYVDLPTDLVLRKLIVQPKSYGLLPSRSLAEVRIDEDNLKRIPFDLDYENLRALQKQNFGIVDYPFSCATHQTAAYPIYNPVADMSGATALNVTGVLAVQLIGQAGCKLILETAADTDTIFGRGYGIIPCFMICYPFGDQKDIADWYDITRLGSLRLRIKDGPGAEAIPCTTRVILQQLRRY